MSWRDIDNTKKKKIDRNFLSCDERDGKEIGKFKEYENKYGKKAVDYCCKQHNNRKRENFEKCLKGYNK